MHCLAVFKLVPANCSHPTNLSVIPQRFRCVLRVPLPCGQTKSALMHWTPAKVVMLNLFQHLAQSASHQPFGVIPQRECLQIAGIVALRGGRSQLLYTRTLARGTQSVLLHTGHPQKLTGVQYVKVDCVHPLQGGGNFMSAPGGRTEIFDFEAGDASEARVYYSGNSRWGSNVHVPPIALHSLAPWTLPNKNIPVYCFCER